MAIIKSKESGLPNIMDNERYAAAIETLRNYEDQLKKAKFEKMQGRTPDENKLRAIQSEVLDREMIGDTKGAAELKERYRAVYEEIRKIPVLEKAIERQRETVKEIYHDLLPDIAKRVKSEQQAIISETKKALNSLLIATRKQADLFQANRQPHFSEPFHGRNIAAAPFLLYADVLELESDIDTWEREVLKAGFKL